MKSILFSTSLLLSMINGISASEVIISKSGPFDNYDRCEVSVKSATLYAGSSHGNQLVESTAININSPAVLKLGSKALLHAETPYYRWFQTQTDYKVRSSSGHLSTYYSRGFKNINNDSSASLLLREKTDQICDDLKEFKLLGSFILDLKIGNRIFKDELIIHKKYNLIFAEYIVPNSFTSKINDLNYKNGKFTFTIHVKEGNEEYDALFEGTINNHHELKGKAYILPKRSLLGTFTGQRN